MKKYLFILLSLLIVGELESQTLIATSEYPINPTYQSQRRVIRDSLSNVLAVYELGTGGGQSIWGVYYDNATETWDSPGFLSNGGNPTLAIDQNGKVHRLFEAYENMGLILYTHSEHMSSPSGGMEPVSDALYDCRNPVADVDSAGVLNAFWIRKDSLGMESLLYVNFENGNIVDKKVVLTKDTILNIAIATHLQYLENELYFAIQYNTDSLMFCRSSDYMLSYDTIYQTIGSQPAITYNSEYGMSDFNFVRLVYIDQGANLMEVEIGDNLLNPVLNQIPVGQVDLVCVDNLAPPIGFSYLFMQSGSLFHGFSYGALWGSNSIMEEINGNIHNPSIAYRNFNFEFVDFIWQEETATGYNLYHMRDDKHVWSSINDNEEGKGYKIITFPNPFSEELTINLNIEDANSDYCIEIYNTKSQLVRKFKAKASGIQEIKHIWDATLMNGEKADPGIYVIMITVNKIRTARKVLYVD